MISNTYTIHLHHCARLKEEPFSILYADTPSRSNILVNVLVVPEYLKAGFGWSDEELYDAFIYNMHFAMLWATSS